MEITLSAMDIYFIIALSYGIAVSVVGVVEIDKMRKETKKLLTQRR